MTSPNTELNPLTLVRLKPELYDHVKSPKNAQYAITDTNGESADLANGYERLRAPIELLLF